MGSLWQDLQFGARTMRRNPGFTVVAVLTLALGIGANTAIFTWLNATLITLLPGVQEPRQLTAVMPNSPTYGLTSVSYPDYRDFRDRSTTLAGLVAYEDTAVSMGDDGKAERAWVQMVSGNFFDVLGVRALHGRTFLPEEDSIPNAHPVAVLSYGLWQRQFGGDVSVVGRSIRLNTRPFTVIGVAPRDFQGGEPTLAYDLWVPLMMQGSIFPGKRLDARGDSWLSMLGRLKAGVTVERAQAELSAIARQLQKEYPGQGDRGSVSVFPLWKSPRGATSILGPVLLLMMVVVALVLLIACANVANLLLARASSRNREVAIRLSLGAGRYRLIRQLLAESILLSSCGGAAGLLLSWWGVGLLRLLVPATDMPIRVTLDVDARVLAFTFVLSAVTGLVFGLVPAWRASKTDMVTPLKDGSGHSGHGLRKGLLRDALVVAQVATSLLLLVAAGLFLRSLEQARAARPGFNPEGVLLGSVNLFPNGYDAERGRAFYREFLTRLRSAPGVASVTLARRVPLGLKGNSSRSMTVEGYEPGKEERPWTYVSDVGPDYLRTMQIPLVRGRDFADSDSQGSAPVVVVNETLAGRYWPGANPLGKRISFDGEVWMTVVGVSRNARIRTLNEQPASVVYRPLLQAYRPDVTVIARSGADPIALRGILSATIRDIDPALPLFGVTTLQEHISLSTYQQRLAGILLSVFGGLALTLASVGIYGVVAFAVSQRTREIGVRIALGAGHGRVLALVVTRGMAPVGAGLVLGLAGSAVLTGLLGSMLYSVSPTDPLTFLGVTGVLVIVAASACVAPARRATRVDPVVALRHD